jgi:hypothetical protein
MQSTMRQKAERREDGRMIWEKTVSAAAGGTNTVEVDVTALIRPGRRETGNVEHLIMEAELHDRGQGGKNPAHPIDAETARRADQELDKRGLDAAWRDVEEKVRFP